MVLDFVESEKCRTKPSRHCGAVFDCVDNGGLRFSYHFDTIIVYD